MARWQKVAAACVLSLTANLALAGPKANANASGPPLGAITPETLTDDDVVKAMKAAVDYLLSQQVNGTWEKLRVKCGHLPAKETEGGATAFVTYALLHAGQSLKDDKEYEQKLWRMSPELKPAIEYLKTLNTPANYVKAYQIAVLAHLPDTPENRALQRQQAAPSIAHLLEYHAHHYRLETPLPVGYVPGNPAAKQPAMVLNPAEYKKQLEARRKGQWDNSNTQIALLGIWELANARVEIKNDYWKTMYRHWVTCQDKDGSWNYGPTHNLPDQLAMTAAGLASMYILQEQLDDKLRSVSLRDPVMDAGWKWLHSNFQNSTFLSGYVKTYYYMYCLERVGLAAGRKYINNQDWYRYGAALLCGTQSANGAWAKHISASEGHPTLATAFALIFLARGRNPVAFNKLEYPGDTWDARPRDAANITSYMARSFERAINWQIVDIASKPEDWSDAPILLITGSRDPNFTAEQIGKLGTFIANGGMIFSTADDGNSTFTSAMQKYASKISGGKYDTMRPLPPDHIIFKAWDKTAKRVNLLGLSNGAREIWVHSPVDMGASWQRRANATTEHFTIPTNIYLYASGGSKSLAPKLKSLKVAEGGTSRGRAAVARLEYPGNWDPEPGAWKRFAKILRKDAGLDLDLSTPKVEDLDAGTTKIAHLTGTAPFTIPAAGMAKLKAFLEAGGTLLIDNCGGKDGFDKSARVLINALSKDPAAPLSSGESIFSGDCPGGVKIERISLRPDPQGLPRNSQQPTLEGVKINGRYAILYSREDITSGLLGINTMGVQGYRAESAVALMRNMICYAAK